MPKCAEIPEQIAVSWLCGANERISGTRPTSRACLHKQRSHRHFPRFAFVLLRSRKNKRTQIPVCRRKSIWKIDVYGSLSAAGRTGPRSGYSTSEQFVISVFIDEQILRFQNPGTSHESSPPLPVQSSSCSVFLRYFEARIPGDFQALVRADAFDALAIGVNATVDVFYLR